MGFNVARSLSQFVINNENGRIYLGSGNVERYASDLLFLCLETLQAVDRKFNCVSDVCH